MCRNTEMYGCTDPEAYADAMQAAPQYRALGLAAGVCDEIAVAQEEAWLDPAAAQQRLNRVRFLIARCCPLAGQEVASD